MTRAVLCDIEGTTMSLSFAQDVLFPISRKKMDSFVRENWTDPELQPVFVKLNKQTPDEAIRLLQMWIDEDRKEGLLKQIQGKIWKSSFESGQIRSHIYPDVPENWEKWKRRGIRIYIYSSGSVEAQKLLFQYSEAGDLTQWIDGYFDTTMGPKKEANSYRNIAGVTQLPPEQILFLSDVVSELDAAKTAGLQTTHVIREEIEKPGGSHPAVKSFDEINL
jgi:enolase-phosphatase E1